MPGLPVVGKAHEAGRAGAPFVWFIYGSSLDREAFAHWAGEHGYRVPDFSAARPARLDGFRLAFDVQSRFWGGAVASLREAAGESVEGLALPMSGDARGLVDHKEGAISGLYTMFPVELAPVGGGDPIAAVAYRAARPLDRELPPSRAFVETLVKGARASGLSAAWVDRLQRLL
ncbi:MAG TPA: gamma-glutamylcyclotransferase family protein [Polyangia bacterium]